MSRHNRERRQIRANVKNWHAMTPLQRIRMKKHGKRKLKGIRTI